VLGRRLASLARAATNAVRALAVGRDERSLGCGLGVPGDFFVELF
jgi:hypothetical protein